MNESNHERINDYLRTLEKALGGPREQSREIVGEVRADLNAHIESHLGDGHSDDEAVEHALEEMGNAYELANLVRREIPPFGGRLLTLIRYVAASGVMLWMLLMLWYLRAGTYGASGLTATGLVLLLHLPIILLLWPRIVWRMNWLFGLIPAGLGLGFAIFLAFGSTTSTQTIYIPQTDEEVAAMNQQIEAQAPALSDSELPSFSAVLVLIAEGFVVLILLIAMQQRSQRRMIILCSLIAVVLVEVPYQIEEAIFRQDRKRAVDYLDAAFKKSGTYPSAEVFVASGPRLRSKAPWLVVENENFYFYWSRPLSPGFSICSSSKDGRIWVQD